MKISVVIPAFNEEKLIAASLAAIRTAMSGFTEKGWATELIVCDNNSTDRTSELARAAGAIVVFEPINQIGRARNRGAAAATGDWLVFVDADSHPSRELFMDVAETIESGNFIFGGSTVKMEGCNLPGRAFLFSWHALSRLCNYAAGAFIFCEAAAFHQVGGFNEQLFASEEIDLSKRMKSLARAARKRVVILHRHPIATSSRKLRLYSAVELLRLLLHAMVTPRRFVRSREACHAWYDGRR